MADQRDDIVLTFLAAFPGAFGVVALVFSYLVRGWIGIIGCVSAIFWMIFTTPATSRGNSNAGLTRLWRNVGGTG